MDSQTPSLVKNLLSDLNECTMGTADCVNGATCVNTVGSFTCTCRPGFSGDGRTRCTGMYINSLINLIVVHVSSHSSSGFLYSRML